MNLNGLPTDNRATFSGFMPENIFILADENCREIDRQCERGFFAGKKVTSSL